MNIQFILILFGLTLVNTSLFEKEIPSESILTDQFEEVSEDNEDEGLKQHFNELLEMTKAIQGNDKDLEKKLNGIVTEITRLTENDNSPQEIIDTTSVCTVINTFSTTGFEVLKGIRKGLDLIENKEYLDTDSKQTRQLKSSHDLLFSAQMHLEHIVMALRDKQDRCNESRRYYRQDNYYDINDRIEKELKAIKEKMLSGGEYDIQKYFQQTNKCLNKIEILIRESIKTK